MSLLQFLIRIANSGKKEDSDNESEENVDDDWNYHADRKGIHYTVLITKS